jgi:HK97 family phage major capsid protein
MTLVKYTKKIELSYELLQDEESRLMAFLDEWVGRGMAQTHNSLLITEALAGGTNSVALAASSIATAKVPELVYALGDQYVNNAQWVAKRSTEGALRALVGDNFQFVPTPQGQAGMNRELFGYNLYNSEFMPAIGAGNKSLLFGNFRYMGMRLAPDVTVLRDPYSKAGNGQVVLHYYFRTVYKVLQAEAIRYATHATA